MNAPENTPDFPYTFTKTAQAAELHERFGSLEPGQETEEQVSIAGRLMLRRVQGKLTFGTLADATGRIQLFAPSAATPNYESFSSLSLGDWIGVSGKIMTTKKGELSVRVEDWVLLAKTQKPFPEKWHGLADQDLRYRQRYLDLWANEESRQTFKKRSQILSLSRQWLQEQGFVEVETPMLQDLPGGAEARPFATTHNALNMELFLRVAPELYLKRMVIAGMEKVFEIGRVFRNEGLSTRHNPEFTMLEAYAAYCDYEDMMNLTQDLIVYLAKQVAGQTIIPCDDKEIDLTPPWRRANLLDLIKEQTGLELDIDMKVKELAQIATGQGVEIQKGWGAGKLILEIYEKTTEPNLWGPVFVCDYPKEVSPLARDHRTKPHGWVERFELIVAGKELANAFSELTSPQDQEERFLAQKKIRETGDEEAMRYDADYVEALKYGLPPTGGLGIGIDRLVMLLTDSQSIRDVLLFPTLRPPAAKKDSEQAKNT